MKRLLVSLALGCAATAVTPVAHADLFDTARKAVRTDISQYDTSGVSIRGGGNFSTGQSAHSATLLRANANIGSGCGSFDFAASLKETFEEIPSLLGDLAQQLPGELVMIAICQLSPTACDVAKHIQALSNVIIQARFAQCQAATQAASYIGARLREGSQSQCLEAEANAGHTITEALRTCNQNPSSMRGPDGNQVTNINLVQDTLAAAGASQETQTLAKSLVGEITLRAGNGPLFVQSDHPQAALFGQYEAHKQEAMAALRAAVDELRETGTVSQVTLQAISIPGYPIDRVTLDALVAMRNDPIRFETYAGVLTSSVGIARLTWQCHELQSKLLASTQGNVNLTQEAKRLLEKQVEAVGLELAQFNEKLVVSNAYVKALDALKQEYAGLQAHAQQLGLRAPSRTLPTSMPYGGIQTPLGVSQ